ncbi:MAG: nucleotidyltransferase family protein [Anaerolineales bacterium]|nr:nucleotidyltransferase family protein [Anaerolineales bacterium]
MNRENILTTLQKQRPKLSTLGIKTLALFGSAARDEIHAGSDIDILVSFRHTPVTFDAYMDIKIFLEDLLAVPVDLVVDEALRPRLRPFVQKDIVYVA